MPLVSSHKLAKNLLAAKKYSFAGRFFAVQADHQRAMRLWENNYAVYQPNGAKRLTDKACSGAVEIYARAKLPVIPAALASQQIGMVTTYFDQKKFWVEDETSFCYASSPNLPKIKIWLKPKPQAVLPAGGTNFSSAIAALLRRVGCFGLHGAGVQAPQHGKGVLILGASGCGKSSLTMRLAARGWRYLSDDYLLLHTADDAVQVSSGRSFFAVTAETVRYCVPDDTSADWDAPVAIFSAKKIIAPEKLFAGQAISACAPAVLVFPQLTGAATSALLPLSPAATMMKLIPQCPWLFYDPATAENYARILQRLTAQCQSYQLNAGRDLLEQPARADQLLQSILRNN